MQLSRTLESSQSNSFPGPPFLQTKAPWWQSLPDPFRPKGLQGKMGFSQVILGFWFRTSRQIFQVTLKTEYSNWPGPFKVFSLGPTWNGLGPQGLAVKLRIRDVWSQWKGICLIKCSSRQNPYFFPSRKAKPHWGGWLVVKWHTCRRAVFQISLNN